jgi:hypothetical protein
LRALEILERNTVTFDLRLGELGFKAEYRPQYANVLLD